MVGRPHLSDSHSTNAADPTLALWDQLLHSVAEHPLAQRLQECEPEWDHDRDDDACTAPTPAEIESLLSRLADRSSGIPEPPQRLFDNPSFLSHDPELQAAFLEDLTCCIGRLQPALLHLKADPSHTPSLNRVRCELHTLKGVSATVGLLNWAEHLHRVEDQLQDHHSGNQQPIDSLLAWVEQIQTELQTFQHRPNGSQGCDHGERNSSAPPSWDYDQTQPVADECVELTSTDLRDTDTRDTVRLSAVQFERLVRAIDQLPTIQTHSPVERDALYRVHQQLTSLQMQPARRLFRRLQQAVHSVAQAENKEVQLELLGEDLPLERPLEQRLFEPLMHLVRNSVCHGIEPPAQRLAAGKPACGTVRIELKSNREYLLIEVADDGGGLDVHAIRQRGIELGLLAAAGDANAEQLNALIFHPSFSTRKHISQGAGRGMGMSSVLSAVEELGGWLEVDSQRRRGTCIRLFIPATPYVEHVVLFRCGQNLFAIPGNAVESTGAAHSSTAQLDLTALFPESGSEPPAHRSRTHLTCRVPPAANTTLPPASLTLLVDQIIGSEPLIIQPFSALLKHHPYCTGAALTACGATVFLINIQKLAAVQTDLVSQSSSNYTKPIPP